MNKHGALVSIGLLILTLSGTARADGVNGITQVLDPDAPKPSPDSEIASALALAKAGQHDEALERFRRAVHITTLGGTMKSAKARYFLAKAYLDASRRAGSGPAAERHQAQAHQHLRGALALRDDRTYEDNAEWGEHARSLLRRRSSSTPLLNQHASGQYPWGYCAPTVLRMILRLERLRDPGADAVALQGATPYQAGSGSDGARLASRAQQLGLQGARFTKQGGLEQVLASIDAGRPAGVAGIGPYRARLANGQLKSRRYDFGHWLLAVDYTRDAAGRLQTIVLNDPDGGARVTMERADFDRFFMPDGKLWTLTYGG